MLQFQLRCYIVTLVRLSLVTNKRYLLTYLLTADTCLSKLTAAYFTVTVNAADLACISNHPNFSR